MSQKIRNFIGEVYLKRKRHKKITLSDDLKFNMEQTMGLEPTTSAMARRRSSQLSYVCVSDRIGAGGRVRTGTSKGWSLSALAHLSYPRTTPPNKGEYRKYFMISNFSPRYTRISSFRPARASFLHSPESSSLDQWRRLHLVLHHWNWEHCVLRSNFRPCQFRE